MTVLRLLCPHTSLCIQTSSSILPRLQYLQNFETKHFSPSARPPLPTVWVESPHFHLIPFFSPHSDLDSPPPPHEQWFICISMMVLSLSSSKLGSQASFVPSGVPHSSVQGPLLFTSRQTFSTKLTSIFMNHSSVFTANLPLLSSIRRSIRFLLTLPQKTTITLLQNNPSIVVPPQVKL